MKYLIVLLICLCSLHIYAKDDESLSIDRFIPHNFEFVFPNDEKVAPIQSDFELEHFVLMSNLKGERWAVLTLTNSSRGNRQLEPQHLMAVFADGRYGTPEFQNVRFKGNETLTLTVYFGESKFPVLSVFTYSK